MNIIKLNAIPSTNEHLKQLVAKQVTDNFTVVWALHQTNGKGQMGSTWDVEKGKNLTISILVKDLIVDVKQLFTLNIVVSLAVISVLEKEKIPHLSIKWPNDIMSGQHKLGGILIENSIKTNGEVLSFIGIGLNVNQLSFINLPNASSLIKIMGLEYDLEQLLNKILSSLQFYIAQMRIDSSSIWKIYHQKLFKIGIPAPFEKPNGEKFMAIIHKVTSDGKLELLLENDELVHFDVKEVKLLY
jgi:BirA family biotin operon repressor/biotin-[acetyl-CoA-carboxylase] ligase